MGSLTHGLVLPLLLALVASVFFAVAWVLQYHEAHAAPKRLYLSPRLLLELAHHPLWLAGLAGLTIGSVVQGAALGTGSLAVVEPVLTTSLLFALWLSAAWRRARMSRGEWAAALMVSGGLALLLGVGSPGMGRTTMTTTAWIVVTAGTWAAAALLVALSRRRGPAPRAAMVAAGAGVLFGLQDVLTRSCVASWRQGVVALMMSWQPYVMVVTALAGLTLMQSAYECGPLTAALPPLAIGEPVVGMLIGVVALDEHLRTAGADVLWEAAGIVVMVVGTTLLARSRLVLGTAHPDYPGEPAPDTEPADVAR